MDTLRTWVNEWQFKNIFGCFRLIVKLFGKFCPHHFRHIADFLLILNKLKYYPLPNVFGLTFHFSYSYTAFPFLHIMHRIWCTFGFQKYQHFHSFFQKHQTWIAPNAKYNINAKDGDVETVQRNEQEQCALKNLALLMPCNSLIQTFALNKQFYRFRHILE